MKRRQEGSIDNKAALTRRQHQTEASILRSKHFKKQALKEASIKRSKHF